MGDSFASNDAVRIDSPEKELMPCQEKMNDGMEGNSNPTETKIRMLEFFSGIGGMRISLEKALVLLNGRCNDPLSKSKKDVQRYVLESCRAYDISLHANNVYQHNFSSLEKRATASSTAKGNHVCTKLVEQLKPKDIVPLRANLWTMSPPCQPFTTSGEGRGKKRLDASDKRCNGLKGIAGLLDALPVEEKPKWILLENVKGFAGSHMCTIWCDCLKRNGYSHRSFVLSPIEFGIPNHRTRYYLLAERDSKRWSNNDDDDDQCETSTEKDEIKEASSNDCTMSWEQKRKHPNVRVHQITSLSAYDEISKRPLHAIGRYLIEDHPSSPAPAPSSTTTTEQPINDDALHHENPYLVPNKVLSKTWSKGLGIVSKKDTATHCFTAGYGRIYHRSTGSLLLIPGSRADCERKGAALQTLPLDRSDMSIYQDQLRRFQPQELLRLFGFVSPEKHNHDGTTRVFEIPSRVVPSLEQRYKLIGNSISVDVVTELLRELLLSG